MKRRELFIAGAAALSQLSPVVRQTMGETVPRKRAGRIPLVHITDLYHPPQDPDDHIDLATAAALEEFDIKGVILDVTQRFLDAAPAGFDIRRDPGLIPVAQLGYILGHTLPAACGPTRPLSSVDDTAEDSPREEQAGINLVLDILTASPEKVVVSIVGSARVLTAAFNRAPALVRSKVRSVLLNAGSTGGAKQEWNVGLDTEAYKGLWTSGLPIHWYPCAVESGAFTADHERGTYWKNTHAAIFRDISAPLRAWFAFAFTGAQRGDSIAAMKEDVSPDVWNKILGQSRNMWATASLVMAAGRVLARTGDGWRFVPSHTAMSGDVWSWRLDRIRAEVGSDAVVHWQRTEAQENALLFGREQRPGYGDAMAEALAHLLGSIGR